MKVLVRVLMKVEEKGGEKIEDRGIRAEEKGGKGGGD